MTENIFVVREATCDDYQSVLDIDRDVYQGFDYLRSVYYEMIHDKLTYMYIGERGSEVVAFMGLRLIKNCTVAVSVAMRTSKKLRGTGIANPLKEIATREIKKKWPSLRELIIAVPTGTFPKYWDKLLADPSQQDNILLRWHSIAYEIARNRLDQILVTQMASTVDRIAVERMCSNVSTRDISRIMQLLRAEGEYFPHYYWIVQPVTEKYISYVNNTSHVYVTRKTDGVIKAVTHASVIQVISAIVRLDIWFHGLSREICIAHCFAFLKDINLVFSPATKTIRMLLNVPAAMEESSIEEDLAPFLGPRYTKPPTYTRTLALLYKSKI